MGSETGSGVKPVKGDVPSEPVYGLDATSSSMVGASRWAEEGGQLNGMEERWGLVSQKKKREYERDIPVSI